MCGERFSICNPGNGGRCALRPTSWERTCKGRFRQAGAKNAAGKCTNLGKSYAKCAKGGSRMKKSRVYELPAPCRGCTRVKIPSACDNKDCKLWQMWFTRRWEKVRAYPRQQMDKTVPMGVLIGGRWYLPPDQMRQYIKNDPCESCKCPKELCQSPCRVKQVWLDVTKEVKR